MPQGPTSGKAPDSPLTPEEWMRFYSKVRVKESHWIWQSAFDDFGYPRFGFRGKVYQAHRISAYVAGIVVPPGMCIDHTCRIRACVNPRHLRVVTPRVNAIENNDSPIAFNARKTHCLRGHAFTPENTAITHAGGRECIACRVMRRAIRKAAYVSRRAAP